MMMVMMAMPSDDRSAAASVAPGDQGGAALPWPEINTRGGGYGGGRAHDFTLEEDAEVFFFGHDVETGLPVGTHRQGGLPNANLKWAGRDRGLTPFTTLGTPIPNTEAGRRKLQNRLIALKKRLAEEGKEYLHQLRVVREAARGGAPLEQAGPFVRVSHIPPPPPPTPPAPPGGS